MAYRRDRRIRRPTNDIIVSRNDREWVRVVMRVVEEEEEEEEEEVGVEEWAVEEFLGGRGIE